MTIDVDIALDEYGDFITGIDGDIDTLEGINVLIQDLHNRMITPRGSLAESATWGEDLRRFLQMENDPNSLQMVAEIISAELGRDERLEDRPTVTIEEFENGRRLRVRVQAVINGEPIDFTVEV